MFITAAPVPYLTLTWILLWLQGVMKPLPQWLCTVSRDGERISRVWTLGDTYTPAPALLLQMLIVGGGWTGFVRLDSTEIFDPRLGSWRAGATLPCPMFGLRATNIDNRVLFFGNDILYSGWLYKVSWYIPAGGNYNTDSRFDTILEYDITGESYTQVGTVIQARYRHAISVVKYEDYSEWCEWGSNWPSPIYHFYKM